MTNHTFHQNNSDILILYFKPCKIKLKSQWAKIGLQQLPPLYNAYGAKALENFFFLPCIVSFVKKNNYKNPSSFFFEFLFLFLLFFLKKNGLIVLGDLPDKE